MIRTSTERDDPNQVYGFRLGRPCESLHLLELSQRYNTKRPHLH